jgi:integrase
MKPPNGLQLIGAFCAYMEMRGLSTHTIRRRRSSLGTFAKWVEPLSIEQADADHVESWLSTQSAPRTRHAYRSDLSAFYQWGVRRKVMPTNPVAETDSIRVPKAMPRPVPIGSVPSIIDAAPTERLRLALMLAAYAGLRRAEITSITGGDVQFFPVPLLMVRSGKGSKDRMVPLHPALRLELDRPLPAGRLVPWSPDRLGKVAAEHMRRMGFDCTLHQLRSSFATELARVMDGNIVAVGKVLGHESPQTTMGYCGWGGGETASKLPGLYVA